LFAWPQHWEITIYRNKENDWEEKIQGACRAQRLKKLYWCLM
jgi:hypothetical protein